MKRIPIILLVCFLITFIIGCDNGQAQRPVNNKAIDFRLKDLDGNIVTLSDYSGKVIILNFFATWCPPCRNEMPDFNEIANEYRNDVEILAINLGEDLSKIKDFANTFGLKFKILLDDGRVSREYGPIRAIPVSIIINKNFKIAKKYIGARSKEVFVSDIKALGGRK